MTGEPQGTERVMADRERCVGAGLCVLHAPDVFDQGDDGRVIVLDASPPSRALGDARTAVAVCPASALSLRRG